MMRHYRFTEYTQLLFFSLLQSHSNNSLNSCWIYLPQIHATMMCRKGFPNDLPEKITCQSQVDSNPWILLPELGAIPARGIDLPEKPPSPTQNPQAGPGPPFPPRAQRNGGGGGGWRLTRLANASWTGTFPFILPYMVNLHVLYDTTYTHSIKNGLMNKSITILPVGAGNIC